MLGVAKRRIARTKPVHGVSGGSLDAVNGDARTRSMRHLSIMTRIFFAKVLTVLGPRHGQVEEVDGDPGARGGEEGAAEDVPLPLVDLVRVAELKVGERVAQQPGQHQQRVEDAAVPGDRVGIGVDGEEGALLAETTSFLALSIV